ncbi:MAG: GT4 family glycosyltransferase PelF [Desulfurobacteriaceae bacterium]
MVLVDKKKEIDILIIAEGTYPFVRGGVSSWIRDLINGLSEFNFGVVFVGSRKEDYGDIKYPIPENLVYLSVHYLFDSSSRPPPRILEGDKKHFEKVRKLHHWFKNNIGKAFPKELHKKEFYEKEITEEEFLYSKRAWEFIEDNYLLFARDTPFIDYFWTIRNVHAPIWRVASIVKDLKPIKLVHSPSTGYAGFLASLIKNDRKVPFLLTEHGIYTRERKIDILSADWIQDRRLSFQRKKGEVEHLKEIWINFFIGLGKLAYETADKIISLFDDARKIQISLGAPPEKTLVIPNGVRIENYLEARKKRGKNIPKVIGLIGRVVPIKDIKTFIKAIRIVANKIPEVEGWIIGPTEEDPSYYEECKKLVYALNLKRNVKFLGFQKIPEVLPKVGLTTLTSISEGMPLVVLESFAGGVPVVSTDVGSCHQLIYGGLCEEDKALGKAGEVTPVANPSALADAYIKYLTDEDLWESSHKAAIERVEKFYSFEAFIDSYRKLYSRYSNGGNIV